MPRKHKHEEHENHERWLVSYADFITLLFAFFVVMYSVSAVNEGKFRTVSESIKAALSPVVSRQVTSFHFDFGNYRSSLVPSYVERKKQRIIYTVQKFVKGVNSWGGGPGFSSQVVATSDKRGVLITIPDNLLFASARADVNPEALPILEALATVLGDSAPDVKDITVQGHTDNVPIHTPFYPSNWELSAARAVSVVRLLTERFGVPADKISASGHGEFKPVVDNLTPESRARNRRVEVLLVLEDAVAGDQTKAFEVSSDPTAEQPVNRQEPGETVDGDSQEQIVPIPELLQPPVGSPMSSPAPAPAPSQPLSLMP